MQWSDVGDWLGKNAGPGASLVGSLLSGNVPGAIAAGVALVGSATGTTDPDKALSALQSNPESMIKLKELAYREADSIRAHIRSIEEVRLKDAQAEQAETAKVTISGDNAEDVVVRRTRPLQSWLALFAAIYYVFARDIDTDYEVYVLGLLLALPWSYAGLRQVGKGIEAWKSSKQ